MVFSLHVYTPMRATFSMGFHAARTCRPAFADTAGAESTPADAKDDGDDIELPSGLSLDKLIEAGEEIFAKRKQADAGSSSCRSSADALGLAQRMVEMVRV